MGLLIKFLSGGVALGAGALARKGLEVVWRKRTGNAPPKDAQNLNNSLPGVLIFSLVTALTGALIQVLTKRAARKVTLRLQHKSSQT